MLSELRDINYGPMRFYYLIGWGVPAFVTGLAVGLDPEGYGNPDYCWLSMYDTLIWSFAGPIAMVVGMNIFLYILASRASCTLRRHGFDKKDPPVSGLRTAGGVLFLVTVTCLLALLSVNSDMILFHYLFAGFNCLLTYKGGGGYMDGRLYHLPFGDSSVSLNGTMQSGKSQQSYVPFVLRDSDSDLSIEDDQSGSYASTHSSDSEDEEGRYPPEECWENLAAKRPHPHGPELLLVVEGPAHTASTQGPAHMASLQGPAHTVSPQGPAHTVSPQCPTRDNRTPPDERPGDSDCSVGATLGAGLHQHHHHHHHHHGHPQKGILKKKQLSPIAERNGLHRIHNQLSEASPGPGSPRRPGGSPSASSSSSSSSGEGRPGAPKPPLADHLNGVAMTIKAGTVLETDGHAGSANGDEEELGVSGTKVVPGSRSDDRIPSTDSPRSGGYGHSSQPDCQQQIRHPEAAPRVILIQVGR
ncbi:hypothetical protein CRUP_017201 [Coryphaenoides rupestris]|nr:hypothetical protein CRUP_017201 [Coryphaenoides rupestris]